MRKKQRKSKYTHKVSQVNSGKFIVVILSVVGVFFIAAAGIILRYWIATLSETSGALVVPVVAQTSQNIEEILSANDISVKSLEYRDSGNLIYVEITDGPTVVFSATKDLEKQVKLLQSILARLRIENKKPTEVQLHYSNPIVKY